MGNYCSDTMSSIDDARISCKFWVRRMLTRPDRTAMLGHIDILIQTLKFDSLKVRIKNNKSQQNNNNENENENINHDFFIQGEEVLVLGSSEAEFLEKQSSWKRQSSYLEVNLFDFNYGSKRRKLKSYKMLNYALQCHDVVEKLKLTLEDLVRKANEGELRNESYPEKLITIGAHMEGEINIPPQEPIDEENSDDEEDHPRNRNMNHDPSFNEYQDDRSRPYDLVIVREVIDETGNKNWIGRHQTYEGRRDKQTVLLNFSNIEAQTGFIHFEDYETHCDGEISEDKNRLHGRVKQLRRGQPGFFVPNRGVEHNFFLERCPDSRHDQINVVRNRLMLARYARALAFAAWSGGANPESVQEELFPGYRLDWSEMIEDMVWICNEVGTMMRRYVQVLDSITFSNPNERKTIMVSLADKGISRRRVHEVWDAATLLLRRLRDDLPFGSAHNGTTLRTATNFADQVIDRLDPIYNRFDKALRRAEKRVCEEYRAQWRRNFREGLTPDIDGRSLASSNQGRDAQLEPLLPVSRRRKATHNKGEISELVDDEIVCTICTTNFEDEEPMYITPCKHAFHVDCLEEWFKQDSVCPICRTDFSETNS